MLWYNSEMLPPILEIYVVWHPEDRQGSQIAKWLLEHFRGTPYTGLIGGAIEVYERSVRWSPGSDAPRPVPCQSPLPYGLPQAQVTVIVPILGVHLARAVAQTSSDWRGYLESIREAERTDTARQVSIFPVQLEGAGGSTLDRLMGDLQHLHSSSVVSAAVLCRELAQAITQFMGDPLGQRLKVFISHTKRHSQDQEPGYVNDLINRIRTTVTGTHLSGYFDTSDLQLGSNWKQELLTEASSNALLAVRTDLYARREWCQREFLVAKRSGMPIVTLSAINQAEERGSFIMDHVPVVCCRRTDEEAMQSSIDNALNMLVDEALTATLWRRQQSMLQRMGFDWMPLHAPEPITLIPWFLDNRQRTKEQRPVLVMHPDPPLGPEEVRVIDELLEVASSASKVDIVTPRTYESRVTRGN